MKYLEGDNKSVIRRLVSNFFSLSSIQIASYILPLLTIPYLAKVLGVEKFGLVFFAQVVIQYFIIFIDYGFGFSATKEIAENKDDEEYISKIFSVVMSIKLVFLILSFFVLNILVFTIGVFFEEWKLFYLSFGVAIGQAIFPVWYYQGIEKMHIMAIFNILPKFFFTLLIFLFVSDSNDYLYVPLINSVGFILSGLIPLLYSIKRFGIVLKWPSVEQVIYQLKEGWHIFLGGISSTFSILNVGLLLGIMLTPAILSYYAAVEKIIRPLALLNRPVINAIFPYLSITAKSNPTKSYNFSKVVAFILAGIMFVVGLALFIFAEELIVFLFGKDFYSSIIILKIMAFLPMLHSIYSIYNTPNMIINGFKSAYSKILFFTLFISIVLSPLLIFTFKEKGAAMASILIELIPVIAMSIYLLRCKKNNLFYSGK